MILILTLILILILLQIIKGGGRASLFMPCVSRRGRKSHYMLQYVVFKCARVAVVCHILPTCSHEGSLGGFASLLRRPPKLVLTPSGSFQRHHRFPPVPGGGADVSFPVWCFRALEVVLGFWLLGFYGLTKW